MSVTIAQPDNGPLTRRAGRVMIVFILIEGGALFAMLGGVKPARILDLFSFHPTAAWGWLLGALVTAAYAYGSARSLPYIGQRFLDVTPLKILVVPFALASGFLEELFFRKVVMDAVAHAGFGLAVQVIVSAVSFGLPHAIFGAFAGRWSAVVSPLLWTTVLGAALAVVYLTAGRDVAPCAWSHTVLNLLIEPWLILAVMRRGRVAN